MLTRLALKGFKNLVEVKIRYLLVTDGSSDACLTDPIDWLLRAQGWQRSDGAQA